MMSNSDSIDISLSGIYRSWYAFRGGKRLSRSIITFEYNLEQNLAQLAKDLQTNRYRHAGYKRLTVNDSKRREIAVACIRDRVVHRLLYDYLVPIMDRQFDYDVWSCRNGKGLQAAVERTARLLRKYPDAWVWRSDVSKFFDSVDHQVILKCIKRFVGDETAVNLITEVLSSYHTKPGKGIAIGNLTSQILSNTYLHELDGFMRHYMKPLGYVRYGDDFVALLPSKSSAEQAADRVSQYLIQELHLLVNQNNNIVVPVRRGLYFLGTVLFADGYKLQNRTVRRMEKRLSASSLSSYHGLVKIFGSKSQNKDFLWLMADVLQ